MEEGILTRHSDYRTTTAPFGTIMG